MQLSQIVRERIPSKEKRYILEGYSSKDLERMLQFYLRNAAQGQTNSQESRSKRIRAEHRTTDFLDKFHNHVQAYFGIVQLMNGAGQRYGDAAYGALSLFLVVNPNICLRRNRNTLIGTRLP